MSVSDTDDIRLSDIGEEILLRSLRNIFFCDESAKTRTVAVVRPSFARVLTIPIQQRPQNNKIQIGFRLQ